jgi:glycosyltransferase involved in cell wall biosynthesis
MRILVTSTLYPPRVLGGYERECAVVVERLRQDHEVLVITSDYGGTEGLAPEPGVRRTLEALTPDAKGSLHAPRAAVRGVRTARAALAFQPDLIYSWNGAAIPHAALRVLADSGVPMAFRVCEHWFGQLFVGDQFLRELLPDPGRSPGRRAWSLGCRALNAAPGMRLRPSTPFPAAISWNSEAIRRMAGVPPAVEPVLERIGHSVPRYGDEYAEIVRDPAPVPEIAFIGRVTPTKGGSVAIEALALLRDEYGIHARLVVAGPEDADHGAELRLLAHRRGVTELIDWLGAGDQAAVARVLARAAAVIVPSVWEEPFPLVTIEAALARVPVVASDVGGIGEGMHDEEHALLFAGGDAVGAARALARILRDADETAARVERAYARAQDFRLAPYLEAQAAFVADAHEILHHG